MSPREVRQRIDALDREIASREALQTMQLRFRQRFLLDDSPAGREALQQIERGIRAGEGCLNAIAELQGKPGLLRTQQDLLRLRERRTAWLELLPTTEQRVAAERSAAATAEEIRVMASKLVPQLSELREAIESLFPRAAQGAALTWQLHAANVSLDQHCSEADIARPETPRINAPAIRVAPALAALLNGHCNGGQPMPVEANVTREIAASATEPS